MITSSVRAQYEPLRSTAFNAITTLYEGVGTPFANPVRILKVTNLTDQDILVSFNVVDDHDIVAANGFFFYDYTSNKSSSGGVLEQPKGNRIYIKAEGVLPTVGNLYVTVVYASQV